MSFSYREASQKLDIIQSFHNWSEKMKNFHSKFFFQKGSCKIQINKGAYFIQSVILEKLHTSRNAFLYGSGDDKDISNSGISGGLTEAVKDETLARPSVRCSCALYEIFEQ